MIFTAILSNEIGWHDKDENSTGSLSSKLATDATLVRSAIADRISTVVQNMALAVTAFVIAFILSWRIAAVVIAIYPILIGANIAEVSPSKILRSFRYEIFVCLVNPYELLIAQYECKQAPNRF